MWIRKLENQASISGNNEHLVEATGHRLKPCGYYGLHRKGPIDLEKYKSDRQKIAPLGDGGCADAPASHTPVKLRARVF